MLEDSDIGIVKRVLRGDQQAFAELVQRYQQYAFTLAMRLVSSREDAEEITQDSFVKAYRYLADFRQESKFSTWLYTIVQRNAISFLRKKKLLVSDISEREERISDGTNAYQQLAQQYDKKMIANALSYLKPEEAAILSLFYLQEQSLEEVGVILGIEANAAKVRLFRARQKFKNVLESHFGIVKRDME